MDVLEVSQKLRKWLDHISDNKNDPWKDVEETESPISKHAKPIDPTQYFTEVSDIFSDSSSEESSLEGEENDILRNYNYRGYRDEDGLFHSSGTITFDNGDIIQGEFKHGIRSGDAVVISPRSQISRLIGTWVDGKLQGKGQLVSLRTINFLKNWLWRSDSIFFCDVYSGFVCYIAISILDR